MQFLVKNVDNSFRSLVKDRRMKGKNHSMDVHYLDNTKEWQRLTFCPITGLQGVSIFQGDTCPPHPP